MAEKKDKQKRGIAIAVSPEAHEKMRNDGYKASPRRNLRQQINFINKLPINI